MANTDLTAMHPRLTDEWEEIARVFPTAVHLSNPERVELELELADTLYSSDATRLAVLVPSGYRATGPDGFLVPNDLTFADGSPLPASDGGGLGMPGWLLVSFHHVDEMGNSTWQPTADFRVGDNFIGYLSSVEHFLARGCN